MGRPRKRRKKPHRNKAIERQKIKTAVVQHQKLIEWLIDENYPQRRAAHIAGYIQEPQEYLATIDRQESEIQAGVVGGLLFNAGMTLLSGGSWLIAGIGLVAGLVQYALAPGEQKRAEDPRYAPSYGGSFGGRMARFGETIPAIFCSNYLDPTGGVQTAGLMIHARIVTINGSQTSYSRYIISHGNIGEIDLDRTVINEQPKSHFYANNITLTWHNGTQLTAPPDFDFFCQNFPANNNNNIGVGLLDKNVDSTSSGGGGGGGTSGSGLISASYKVAPGATPPFITVGVPLTMYVSNSTGHIGYPLTIKSIDTVNQTFTTYQNIVNVWSPIVNLYGTNWFSSATITIPGSGGAGGSGGKIHIQPTPQFI